MLTRYSARDISAANSRMRAGQVGGTSTRTTTMPDAHSQHQVNQLARLQSRFHGMSGGHSFFKKLKRQGRKRSRKSFYSKKKIKTLLHK